ncbi:UDP-N-acetylmuramate dehydrogenase [Rickettsiales bacterium]|nr:UDP-N-acetylmuramate dehydrogenase [Rickettsiales bacterium]
MKDQSDLLQRLPKVKGSYRPNADLSKTNWFRVGGQADILFRPSDEKDLSHFLKNKPDDIPVTILGVGSNLLVRDGGIEGVVIKLGRGFAEISCANEEVHAGSSALSFNVSMVSADAGLSGLEFLSGIPGTIGGALAMNAGAYGSDVSSILLYANAVDEQGIIHKLSVDDIGYVYRGNTLPDGMIFTKAVFKGKKGSTEEIKQRIDKICEEREETQPIKSSTSGSTFKNPDGYKAWKLIDEAGCRGLKIGGAQVSEKHCNFLINTGDASAADIENLVEEVRKKVKENSGIELRLEIKIIGKKEDE